MKYSTFAIAAAAGTAAAQQSAYGQCGGSGWTGATTCVDGYSCQVQNDWYSQCIAGTAGTTAATSAASKASTTAVATSKAVTSTKAATSTLVTKVATSPKSSSIVSTKNAAVTTSKASTTSVAATTTRASTSKAATTTAASSTGQVKYAGINISGFDFGCSTDGSCSGSYVDPGTTGQDQMNHFVTDDGLNAFRIPVGWQYLVGSTLGATLDSTFFTKYDAQVQYCLDSGAELCIIDLHNYARWNGALIGASGGPTTAQFSSVWSQLATKYASSPKVAFGLMNEPHDLSSVSDWATAIQTVVTAIRQAGATDNIILLPGNDWTHASTFVSDGSGAALLDVTNIDGSTTNLVFDVHQYSDSDGSGTSTTCTTTNVDAFTTLATWLRTNNRQAFLSEAGGSSDSTCLTDVCAELSYLMENSDVYLGWTGWAAGEFATSYALSETPSGSAGSYTDQAIVTQCIAGIFNKA